MAFCKVCACGEKIVFERRMGYPEYCPHCGRRMADFATHAEDEPIVAELMAANSRSSQPEEPAAQQPADMGRESSGTRVFALRLPDGSEIEIPAEGGIIGRTELGGEELAGYPSVSRQHVRVTPKRSGLLVEDLSTYGTLLNGQRMEKNIPARVTEGTVLTLCNVEAEVITKEI